MGLTGVETQDTLDDGWSEFPVLSNVIVKRIWINGDEVQGEYESLHPEDDQTLSFTIDWNVYFCLLLDRGPRFARWFDGTSSLFRGRTTCLTTRLTS